MYSTFPTGQHTKQAEIFGHKLITIIKRIGRDCYQQICDRIILILVKGGE